jgi:hypothetical protein
MSNKTDTRTRENIETFIKILKDGYNKQGQKQLGFIAEQYQKRLRKIEESKERNTDKGNA